LAWSLLRIYRKDLLNRIPAKILNEFYQRSSADRKGKGKDKAPPTKDTRDTAAPEEENLIDA
jgi:V-type H+-transporting ATPase subunit B